MSAPAPATPDVRVLALTEIRPSRTNPRGAIAKAELEELVASIREKGVVSPVLVRPTTRRRRYSFRWAQLERVAPAETP